MATGMAPIQTTEAVEGRIVHYAERPISFAMFLAMVGEDDNVELVDGVMVEKRTAQLEKRRCAYFGSVIGV